MHQGPTKYKIKVIAVLLTTILYCSVNAQLNTSSEIIETIEDIKIEDDSSTIREENANKPRFDEEFSQGRSDIEEEVVFEDPEEEYQNVQKKDVQEEPKTSYEDELKKNANENKLDRREIFPEDLKNFEVEPIQQAEPDSLQEEVPEPVVESPRRDAPELETKAQKTPKEAPSYVEEPSRPLYYKPEPQAPVIVYENEQKLSDNERKSLSERTKVEIEPDPFVEGTLSKRIGDYLKPYKERRPKWTTQVEIGAAQYAPVNYDSNILENSSLFFEDYYDSMMPMPSVSVEFKRNFSLGAIAFGVGGSYLMVSGESFDGTISSDFELISPFAKVSIYLDMLFDEPYVVPYASFGYSYMMYNEVATDGSGLEYSGASDNFFVALGVLFQLDWLDRAADRSSYELGIENTYLYAEAKMYLDAGIIGYEDDYANTGVLPDFSAPFHLSAGLKMEF